jgi:hypothetical protein
MNGSANAPMFPKPALKPHKRLQRSSDFRGAAG